jgi:hypothetical protein
VATDHKRRAPQWDSTALAKAPHADEVLVRFAEQIVNAHSRTQSRFLSGARFSGCEAAI